MDASGMNPATAAAFEGMMQQKQVRFRGCFPFSVSLCALLEPSD
jgi:hypothetical protein